MRVSLDHIQLAHPVGAEDALRGFYCGILGLIEISKPETLQGRGGFWATAGNIQVHFGVDPDFTPATKAHPAFITENLDSMAQTLAAAGMAIRWDNTLPGTRRFYTDDPVGNRVELMATPHRNDA